jgi:acylphosphatase
LWRRALVFARFAGELSMSEEMRKRLLISGRVQGVWFRGSMQEQADSLGDVKGFVRNLDDGRVEAVVQGDPGMVSKLVEWAHAGPTGARVDRVEVREEPVVAGERLFRVET